MALTLNYSRAGDVDVSKLTYGFLVVGPNGTGKSWAGASAPKPVILFAEKNGIQSARHSNPDAIIVDLHEQFDDETGDKVPAITVLREIMKSAIKGELDKTFGQPVETLVFDSMTEIQRLFMSEISGPGGHMTKQDWGTLADRFRVFLQYIRDCPYHYVCLALVDTQLEEATGIRHVIPSFKGGSTRNEIGQWFNAVCHLYKRTATGDDGKEVTTHHAMFDGPAHYTTKSQHPLRGTHDPNVSDWIAVLTGEPKAADKAAK